MADASALGADGSNPMEVQVLSPAPFDSHLARCSLMVNHGFYVEQNSGRSYHEWFVEFENKPEDIEGFSLRVDENLRKKNIYYDDLVTGKILQPLKISVIKKNGFIDYMKSVGKLGGQNKVPRLSNDRIIADELVKWTEN